MALSTKPWQELLNSLTSTAFNDSTFDESAFKERPENIIKLCYLNEGNRDHLLKWMTRIKGNQNHSKSEEKAKFFRMLGNEKFRSFDNFGSLSLYTESVRYAPERSPELPLALANRSAVLFHLKYYDECVRDIELALLKGYPRSLQHKLYFRQINCLEVLNKYGLAINTVDSARESLKHTKNVDETKIALLNDKLDELLVKALGKIKALGLTEEEVRDQERRVFISPKLGVQSNQLKGRHVVTKEDIKIGQILIVEIPYALVVLPDQYNSNCHHCCATSSVPIPCWMCNQALYCKDDCRQQSWDQYHHWECGGLDIFHSIGIAHLGLRVALKASPLETLRKRYDSLAKDEDLPLAFADKYDSYPDVYHLMPHLRDMTTEDLFQYGCTATMLSLYLAHCTDYFKKDLGSEGSHKDIMFVSEVILRHIAQLVCNGHAIIKLSKPDTFDKVVTEAQVRVATAIYPSASMLNHSCDPNIVNSFERHRLIVKASRDIPQGEEVFNCYGPHFRHMALKERQETLKMQYFFDCTCPPCLQPEGNDFQERFHGLLCPLCGGPLVKTSKGKKPHLMRCLDCGKNQTVKNLQDDSASADLLFHKAVKEVEAGNEKSALCLFLSCLKIREKCLYKNNRRLSACLDMIARCHATLGDFKKSEDYLLRAIPAVEEQFGDQSTEVANEMQKLSDVLIIRLRQETPKSSSFMHTYTALEKCLDRALNIMNLYYGSWDEGLQEIEGKKRELEEMLEQKNNCILLHLSCNFCLSTF